MSFQRVKVADKPFKKYLDFEVDLFLPKKVCSSFQELEEDVIESHQDNVDKVEDGVVEREMGEQVESLNKELSVVHEQYHSLSIHLKQLQQNTVALKKNLLTKSNEAEQYKRDLEKSNASLRNAQSLLQEQLSVVKNIFYDVDNKIEQAKECFLDEIINLICSIAYDMSCKIMRDTLSDHAVQIVNKTVKDLLKSDVSIKVNVEVSDQIFDYVKEDLKDVTVIQNSTLDIADCIVQFDNKSAHSITTEILRKLKDKFQYIDLSEEKDD
ncbi:MAG: hypothetical protein P857_176 [Candidatus Xenolissoclinum pacificiensis L6]|uniref:Flagellar assembly protein FliH/Type III secretion system HrpE domain-containing protein n=1 Tax=Candidatus Xenolissoclinum pacificiensis L6 TaxID=1401685 RepID=W2V238_9RICK|nr:MAG: hypothetical protein P857_176 [Candidatus Xenolissoclinum pacificiensis L6]